MQNVRNFSAKRNDPIRFTNSSIRRSAADVDRSSQKFIEPSHEVPRLVPVDCRIIDCDFTVRKCFRNYKSCDVMNVRFDDDRFASVAAMQAYRRSPLGFTRLRWNLLPAGEKPRGDFHFVSKDAAVRAVVPPIAAEIDYRQ